MCFDVFADLFPKSFQDHVSRLQADTDYRSDFQSSVAVMPLSVWESTPKWRLTAKFRKMLTPQCERCGAVQNLQAHHKTYKHLGAEVLFPGDLEVLCETCHRNAHQLKLWPAAAPLAPQLTLRFPMQ